MRSWKDLISPDDAIDLVQSAINECPTSCLLVDAATESAQRTLAALQVTTRSTLGAIAFHTGGIVVDHGWLRVLGSGSPYVPRSLDGWNGLNAQPRTATGLLIADDILGGFFCLFHTTRTVHYLAPDTLDWEDLGLGYTDWLNWCLTDRLGTFYADMRWEGWQNEVRAIPGDHCFSIYPPLFAKGPPLAERSRRAVPVEEMWGTVQEFRAQLGG